jgi:hypothetical protein
MKAHQLKVGMIYDLDKLIVGTDANEPFFSVQYRQGRQAWRGRETFKWNDEVLAGFPVGMEDVVDADVEDVPGISERKRLGW